MAIEVNKQLGLVAWLTNILHDFDWHINSEGHIVINGDAETVANIFTLNGLPAHVRDGVIHFDQPPQAPIQRPIP